METIKIIGLCGVCNKALIDENCYLVEWDDGSQSECHESCLAEV